MSNNTGRYSLFEGWTNNYQRETAEQPRCTECGLRIRGPNHKKGSHHLQRKAAKEANLLKQNG